MKVLSVIIAILVMDILIALVNMLLGINPEDHLIKDVIISLLVGLGFSLVVKEQD